MHHYDRNYFLCRSNFTCVMRTVKSCIRLERNVRLMLDILAYYFLLLVAGRSANLQIAVDHSSPASSPHTSASRLYLEVFVRANGWNDRTRRCKQESSKQLIKYTNCV